VGDVVVHEEVHQLRQILPVLHQKQKSHLGVDQLARDSVEVDFDSVLLVTGTEGGHGLG
jgi:hypothetical protein